MSMLEFRQTGSIKKLEAFNKGNFDKTIIATMEDARQAVLE